MFILLFLGSLKTQAQSLSGIAITWDQQVGCQETNYDDKRTIGFDDIQASDCLRVCDQSEVNYELYFFPAGATTTWTVVGGTVLSSTNSELTVHWESVGSGSITVSVALAGSTISKTLCIEKIELPKAFFKIATQTEPDYFITCSQQTINFINMSIPSNNSALDHYYWDFGDGNFSTAFEPTHTYLNEGDYNVTLTVYNICNCKETYLLKVFAKRKGFEIACPTVVCEGQSAIYSLPFDGSQICSGNYDWSVIGGQIISQANGNVEVLWDNVDSSGFGYVTFNPQNCSLPCLESTTAKVPVIQTKGTIQGPTELCVGEQGHFKLPQWPTTDIQWEIVGNNENQLGEIILTDQRNEIVLVPFGSGILTLRAVYTNTLLQCSGQAEFQITVGAPLNIIGESSLCQNSTGTFSNSENVSINWILNNESGNTLSNTTAVNFNYLFGLPGTYTLSASSPNYCGIADKVIVVLPSPTPPSGVAGVLKVCPNTPYSYNVENPDANSIYTWVVTNGTVLGSNTGDEVNISFNGTFPATVAVTRKTINPIECTSEPKTITVEQFPVNATIFSEYSTVCSSTVYTYKAYENGTDTFFTAGDTYTWSLSDPSLGSIIQGQGTTEIQVLFNEVTAVTPVNVILTIGKCTITPSPQFVKAITINPKAQIEIQASQNPVCAGPLYQVNFTVATINGVALNPLTDSVTWNLGTGAYTTAPGVFTQSKTFNNNGSSSFDAVVSAVLTGNCSSSNEALLTITVLPNPPAVATISTLGNAFCEPNDVNTTITASSNAGAGATYQWFKNGILIPGQTGTSLAVGASLNFGAYTFKVTSANGCIKASNTAHIYKLCPEDGDCAFTATVTNTSSLTGCNTITFSAITEPAPIESYYIALGPEGGNFTQTPTTLTGQPGAYTIIHMAKYPCEQGGTGTKPTATQVIIPYAPDFSYITECNPNNTFNVNFIDNSNFYSGLSTSAVKFYYKAAGAADFTGPVAYNPSLEVFEIQNLAAGAYVFRVENEGTYQETTFPVCSKEYPVNLQGVNASTAIVVNQTFPIGCHNSAVKFGLTGYFPTGTTYLWDFGDGAENTLANPSRVYTQSDSTYTVKCTIKNPFGCFIERFATVYIPKECFFGDIIAIPSNAEVCKNESVVLTYIPNNDNCTATNYEWMNGSNPIEGATNASTITITQPGSYWVKVKSANDCEYNSPTQIAPLFKKLPNVKINGQGRYCENESIILTATTEADTIVWALNGLVYPQFNNLTETDWTGNFSPSNFTVSCMVTKDGCTNTAFHTFTVEEEIQDIDISMDISCDPYKVIVYANAVSNSGEPVFFNWSNGASGWSNQPEGNQITLTGGGALSVTATTGGGCSFTKQIDIPESPENYMWIFPSGCYSDCERAGNTIIGPLVPLESWSWSLNDQVVNAGNEFTTPYLIESGGIYSMNINTGICDLVSDLLNVDLEECEECKIEEVSIENIVSNNTPYCSFTQELMIYSGAGENFQVTLLDPENNVTIIPSSYTLVPGQNFVQVTIIPNSPFEGGNTIIRFHGQVSDGEILTDCVFNFPIEIPFCESMPSKPTNVSKAEEGKTDSFNKCTLYPNPATDIVNLQYDLGVNSSTLEIYELSGRLLKQQTITTSQGTTQISLNTFAAGIYIVVVRKPHQILFQQKLIINN